MSIEPVFSAVVRAGLAPRGAFLLADDERAGALADVRTIVLVGVTGRSGWDDFAASGEAGDGAEHPLDRWSKRVIDGLARDLGAAALYPFGGPPYFPFQQWARRAEPVHGSPLGLLIHPTYGLWHSYRGALAFGQALDVPAIEATPSPCDTCRGRPCLSACPVGAFVVGGYDVPACVGHLKSAAAATAWSAAAAPAARVRSGWDMRRDPSRRRSPCRRSEGRTTQPRTAPDQPDRKV